MPSGSNAVDAAIERAARTAATSLNLQGMQLTSLPDSIGRCTQLKTLNLSRNKLTLLPATISNLNSLATLNLSHNPLGELPESIVSCTELADLDLSFTQLRALSPAIGNLVNLSTLDLAFNPLAALPTAIGSLAQLMTLDASFCKLAGLPQSIGSCTRLTILNLTGSRLTALPEAIGACTQLTTLKLGNNRLSRLPDSIGTCVQLTTLNLANNVLSSLPEAIGACYQLATLNLRDSRLSELPESIGGCARLVTLNLSGNRLTALPDSIGQCVKLSTLDASNNLLTSLPATINRCSQLQTLILRGNRLTSLPDSIGSCDQLTTLDLRYSRLTALPKGIGSCTQLRTLELGGSPRLVSPPPEVCIGGTAAILVFLQEVQRGVAVQWSSKMLVVGESAVGKTSVSKALCRLPYNRDEPQTHGVHLDVLTLNHPQLADIKMTLNVWDFGGQLHYRATQRFYMTDRSLFVVVWNSRKGWDEGHVEEWLQAVSSIAPASPIILVATHCSGSLMTAPPEEMLKHRYPNITGLVRVDCADGAGIAELRNRIAREAARLPLMGEIWPSAWLTGAKALEQQTVRSVSRSQAEKLLNDAGVVTPESCRELLRSLHDRGKILHYSQDSLLKSVVLLRPDWVDAEITRVLDSQQVRDKGGVLSLSIRETLWQDLEVGLWETLTIMMERFDLAYRIEVPNQDDIALVVEHLPVWEPTSLPYEWDQVMTLSGATELRVIYKFASRQAGIPTWFIAREHRYTTGVAWARGVLLRHRGATHAWALLQDDGQPRPNVQLTVRGPDAYAFFSQLHEAFINIVSDRYPGIDMHQVIPCPCQDATGVTCAHQFDFDYVVQARHCGIKLQCQRHVDQEIDPHKLLLGLEPNNGEAALDRLAGFMNEFGKKTDAILATTLRLEERALLITDAIRDLQHQRSEQTSRCPGIFTLEHVRYPARYRLTLKCESPDGPHSLPDGAGVYEFTKVPDWLRSYAPYLRFVLNALKHSLPMVGPTIIGVVGDNITQDSRSRLELSTKLVESLCPDSLATPSGLLSRGRPHPDFTELRKGLLALDPDFGGLRERVLPESGKIIYLCAQHRGDLHYPAAIAPPSPAPAPMNPGG